jgi:FAD/FMN-containing dehydrogenase
MPDILAELLQALGPEVVTPGEAVARRYFCDWSAIDPTLPRALLRPRSTAEVAAALRLCHAAGQAVVPQGGLTGLAGGATPRAGDIVLSLERLAGIEEIDPAAATLTVKAGTPLELAQRAAEAAGFLLALDLGARGSCQVGGNLSTNAGGNRVIRYGMAREQVLGLEVVLADGTVLTSLNKMLKNNAGYDIKQLFIGAEGTLGIITRAVLRLHARPRSRATAMVALRTYEAVVALLRRAQRELGEISAYEAMWGGFYDFIANHPTIKRKPLPNGHPFYVLMEYSGADPAGDSTRFQALLEAAMEEGVILDAVLAQSEQDARDLWIIREGAPIDSFPLVINFDVSLPIARIDDYVTRCRAGLDAAWPEAHKLFYGHIGDSNLHISVMMARPAAEQALRDLMHAVDAVVYEAVRDMGGSVSAEHGVGTLKRDWLGHSRSEPELALMRVLKQTLDPKGILNPGKVIIA